MCFNILNISEFKKIYTLRLLGAARLCFVRAIQGEVRGQGSGSLPAARARCCCFLIFSRLTSCLWPGLEEDQKGNFQRCTVKCVYCCRRTCSWPWVEGGEKPIESGPLVCGTWKTVPMYTHMCSRITGMVSRIQAYLQCGEGDRFEDNLL